MLELTSNKKKMYSELLKFLMEHTFPFSAKLVSDVLLSTSETETLFELAISISSESPSLVLAANEEDLVGPVLVAEILAAISLEDVLIRRSFTSLKGSTMSLFPLNITASHEIQTTISCQKARQLSKICRYLYTILKVRSSTL